MLLRECRTYRKLQCALYLVQQTVVFRGIYKAFLVLAFEKLDCLYTVVVLIVLLDGEK